VHLGEVRAESVRRVRAFDPAVVLGFGKRAIE